MKEKTKIKILTKNLKSCEKATVTRYNYNTGQKKDILLVNCKHTHFEIKTN